MKEKDLKNHASPSMVKCLRSLGVEFEGTQLIWAEGVGHPLWNKHGGPYYKGDGEYRLYINKGGIIEEKGLFEETILPAPSLQEVIDKLPKQIIKGNAHYTLSLGYSSIALKAVVEYINLARIPHDRFAIQIEDCFLLAALEMAKHLAVSKSIEF